MIICHFLHRYIVRMVQRDSLTTARHQPTVAARRVVVRFTQSGPTVAALKAGTCLVHQVTTAEIAGVRPTAIRWATPFCYPSTPSRHPRHNVPNAGGWRHPPKDATRRLEDL